MIPMRLTEDHTSNVEQYASSDDWVMEQKMDGARVLAGISSGERTRWWASDGGQIKFTAVTQHLPRLYTYLEAWREALDVELLIVDGEVIVSTGEFHVWDVVLAKPHPNTLSAEVRPEHQLRWRRDYLDKAAARLITSGPVRVSYQAVTTDEKVRLFARAREHGVEGVVVKHLDSSWDQGTRSTMWRKLKFTQTADVVVLDFTRGRNPETDRETGSATLGAVDPRTGETVAVGRCSLIGKPPVAVGDVIEVAYMNWSGEAMVQPRMIATRPDKTSAAFDDVSLDQFLPYSRDVVR